MLIKKIRITYWTILIAISTLLSAVLIKHAEKFFYKTQGVLCLHLRFKISQSYQIIKSFSRFIIYVLISKFILSIGLWLLYFDIIFTQNPGEFFVYWNLLQNFETLASPICFLYSHKTFNDKIRVIAKFKSGPGTTKVQTLAGSNMMFKQTQNDYFKKLQDEWNRL
ncbi:unnamed protein product [Caenorhabditis angaria]|uniref:7TM GPCR serpentine receptor class x (Srx) domain-containing protein n=1 Tax=Caenorhabditis angaria TaxID=860376 RepID=A0A9P1N5W1_9PELO|nr:unnamed protein product [Caenorhabditis angaria]